MVAGLGGLVAKLTWEAPVATVAPSHAMSIWKNG